MIGKSFTCYTKTDRDPISILLECKNIEETLLFESGAIAQLSELETETIKKNYTKVVDAYGCLGLLKINIDEDETIDFLVLVTGCTSVGKIRDTEIFKISSTYFVSLQEEQEDESIAEIRKLLNSSTFYFAFTPEDQPPFDLSLNAQRQCDQQKSDNRFLWNRSLQIHLEKFGVNGSAWLLSIMCGGVEIKTVYIGSKQAKACLISRLSCERAGTRFYVRGTNDEGHVANFVETEQLIVVDDRVTSYVQTRGSVPVFWEQPGLQVGSHKVKLSRGFISSSPAFDRHITALKGLYGQILILNLLGMKEGENTLSIAFQDQLKDSVHGHNTTMICFDYHRNCKGGRSDKLNVLREKAKPSIDEFGIFFAKGTTVERRQKGVIRCNCLDCIDRTNNAQTFIGNEILSLQMQLLGLANKSSIVARFEEGFKTMWAKNGDNISRIYIGTGALDGKARVVSKLRDGARSVKRAIRSNFLDGSKQEAIDMLLLGNTFSGDLGERARALLHSSFLHSSPMILRELCDRHLEYTTWSNIRVCVGTWNVNGGRHFRSIAHKHQTMHDWLLDFHKSLPDSGYCEIDGVDFSQPTDVYAIGFEELVDLNASNIVSTSSSQRKEWGEELRRVISRDFPYVLVTCEQLVGVCLYLFVRPHLVPYIRDVAVHAVKTGLGGSAGNKGGVAIRMLLHATSLCFVCSHLAAGQSGVLDRNNDYVDIATRIAFPMGRYIRSHDYVFWCGDFNYRIDLPMDEVKTLIKQKNWDELVKGDQLIKQREENSVFRGYIEGKLEFAPTYKYDLFSDDYDTSEKMRIPAWTDRVLWRRRKPRYKSADHVKKHVIHRNDGNTGDLMRDEEDYDDDEDEDDEDAIGDDSKSSNADIHFHPGKVLYYGKAELKTSDHRPVVALIQVEIQEVNFKEQSKVHESVMQSMGPADPTIVVSCDGDDDDDIIDVGELLEILEACGNAVLVRVVDNDILVTFDDGRSALKALHLDGKEISGKTACIKLKSESLLSNTDLTINTLIGDSTIAEDEQDSSLTTPARGRALSDLLSTSSSGHKYEQVLEPIKIQSIEVEEDEEDGDSEAEENVDYDENYDSDDIDSRTEADRQIEEDTSTSKPKPPRPVQPKRPKPPRPAARQGNTQPEVTKVVDEPLRSVPNLKDDFRGSQEALEHFDPLTQKETVKPKRPPPPKRPAPPKIRPKTEGSVQSNELRQSQSDLSEAKTEISLPKPRTEVKTTRKPAGSGRVAIGMPFNVQHLGHVSADNIEALLVAAKSDPTLLPSFMSGEDEPKVDSGPTKSSETSGTKSANTNEFDLSNQATISNAEVRKPVKSDIEETSQRQTSTARDSKEMHSLESEVTLSKEIPEVNTESSLPAIPTRRPKPPPIPRPRSHIEVTPDEPASHVSEKPKPQLKPKPPKRPDSASFQGDDNRVIPPKPEPYAPPNMSAGATSLQDLATPPVAPQRRRKQLPQRPMSVPSLPEYVAAEANVREGLVPNAGHSLEESRGPPALPKRAGPPPVPRRVDLE